MRLSYNRFLHYFAELNNVGMVLSKYRYELPSNLQGADRVSNLQLILHYMDVGPSQLLHLLLDQALYR